ncbi:MAG: acyltransferase family protein, partial [Acinetobacter sp.]|nr:acyltransferase family protein [Acinetobacter sp.]
MDDINAIPFKRYYDLDALRGIAAIAVLLGHAKGFGILTIEWLNHTYIAVDFFFCLSGFVIMAAYKDKLMSRKITVTDFFVIRIIR